MNVGRDYLVQCITMAIIGWEVELDVTAKLQAALKS